MPPLPTPPAPPTQTAFLTTVDPHTSPRLRDRFGITHLPTLILFRDRKVGQALPCWWRRGPNVQTCPLPATQRAPVFVPALGHFTPSTPPSSHHSSILLQMYRFSGKLTPGSDIQGQLERWVREEYATSPALNVPPPPSPLAWLVKGLEAKAASVKQALETQVGAGCVVVGGRRGCCCKGQAAGWEG